MPLDPYPFSKAIASLVILGQVIGIITLFLLLFLRAPAKGILRWISKNALVLALLVAVVAMGSSLTYSDVLDMQPCKLCWFQRIFIFPQVIILIVALWRKHEEQVTDFCITLACIAIPISIFHYLLQITDAPAVHSFAPCDVTGQAPSCSSYYVIMYGYVTIPMMALTASALILMLMVVRKCLIK